MNRRFFILILFLLPVTFISAQDLSGFWKGTLTMRGCFPENNIELQLSVIDGSVLGDSYHYQDVNNYVKKKLKGGYNNSLKRLSLQEGFVTTYHIPQRCVICVKGFDLVYSKSGNVETLTGIWNGNIMNTSMTCEGGRITLTRIRESAFKEVPEIKVDTGQIRLDFYDNAEIDGDSITVLVNKRVVLFNQLLTGKAVTTYITVDKQNSFHEVEMVANNLGKIPPNTAILIITAGKKRYTLFLTSTEAKSAMVRFVYDVDDMATASVLESR